MSIGESYGENALGSLLLLRAANDDLLVRVRAVESISDKRSLIVGFIERAVASGALFDGTAERRTIQGMIDYWAASYHSVSRDLRGESRRLVTDTTLRAYDPKLVEERLSEAEKTVGKFDEDQKDIARRVLLHLLAAPTGVGQELMAQQFSTISQSKDEINQVVEILIKGGVLRRTDGRIALATDILSRKWPFISAPLALRQDLWRAANQWERDRSKDKLLSARAVADYRKWLDFYSLAPVEVDLLRASDRYARRRTKVWTAWLATTAGAAAILVFGSQLTYRDIWLPRRAPAILAKVAAGDGDATDIRWLSSNGTRLLLPAAGLQKLDLRGLQAVRSDFTSATMTDIDFRKSGNRTKPGEVDRKKPSLALEDPDRTTLAASNFQLATLNNVLFDDAILRAARFDNATIKSASFRGADLSSVAFDGATFCGPVDFSDSNLTSTSFRSVQFGPNVIPKFDHVAWWLADGFDPQQLSKIERPIDPETIPSLRDELRKNDEATEKVKDEPFKQALWIAQRAWTLATYGARVKDADADIQRAIAQLSKLKAPLPGDLASRMANLQDTEGYIGLQLALTMPAGEARTAQLKKAEALLNAAAAFDTDGSVTFRHAVALNALGNTSEADSGLKLALIDRGYSPTHEMHLLSGFLSGDFGKLLADDLNLKRKPVPPNTKACGPN